MKNQIIKTDIDFPVMIQNTMYSSRGYRFQGVAGGIRMSTVINAKDNVYLHIPGEICQKIADVLTNKLRTFQIEAKLESGDTVRYKVQHQPETTIREIYRLEDTYLRQNFEITNLKIHEK